MAITLSPEETNLSRIVQVIRQVVTGRTNSTGLVTLRNGQTTTVVKAPNCGTTSHVFLTPKTAHAAALTPAPYVTPANTLLGSFTITHPNPAVTDATFGWDARG